MPVFKNLWGANRQTASNASPKLRKSCTLLRGTRPPAQSVQCRGCNDGLQALEAEEENLELVDVQLFHPFLIILDLQFGVIVIVTPSRTITGGRRTRFAAIFTLRLPIIFAIFALGRGLSLRPLIIDLGLGTGHHPEPSPITNEQLSDDRTLQSLATCDFWCLLGSAQDVSANEP